MKSWGWECELVNARWPLMPVRKLTRVGVFRMGLPAICEWGGLGGVKDCNVREWLRPGECDFAVRISLSNCCGERLVSGLRPFTTMSSRLTFVELGSPSGRVKLNSESLRVIPTGADTTTLSSDVSKEDCKSIMRPAESRSSFICSCLRRFRSIESS